MSARALIIDDATGAILRKLVGSPSMFALQAGSGQSLFALVDDEGGHIDDAHLIISETGEWEAAPGAPEGLTLPTIEIAYVAP